MPQQKEKIDIAGSNSYQKIGITIGGFLTSFDINLGNNVKKYTTLVGHTKDVC